jgi:hypothetical protein
VSETLGTVNRRRVKAVNAAGEPLVKVWIVAIDVGHTEVPDLSVHATHAGAFKKALRYIRLQCDPEMPPSASPEARICALIDTAEQGTRDLQAALLAWNEWRNDLDDGYVQIEEREVEA